jgi:putative glycosyltransferase (TIGR04348 family)
MKPLPRVRIVSPALASANNGNWHTAERWRRFLAARARVDVALDWDADEPVDVLIALHARRSAGAIARFRAAHPERPIALVLTGTDLYRDIDGDAAARHSLECASALVVLQPEGLRRLEPRLRRKARVILQSAPRLLRGDAATGSADLVVAGHLREEKDPLTVMRAVARLPADSPLRVLHIGAALDPALGQAAERTAAAHPRYRWLGALSHGATRRWIARSRALVHPSRMEGGANVVIEALRSHVPVLASRIDGNVGLLGAEHPAYFEPGDDAGLAALMQRLADDAAFAAALRERSRSLAPRFDPAAERQAVRALLADLVGAPGSGG